MFLQLKNHCLQPLKDVVGALETTVETTFAWWSLLQCLVRDPPNDFHKLLATFIRITLRKHWWKVSLPKKTKNQVLSWNWSARYWMKPNVEIWFVWKKGFDVCINKRDGFDGHDHHVKAALESSPLASLHSWSSGIWLFAGMF